MRTRIFVYLVTLLCLAMAGTAAAGVTLQGTRVIYDAGKGRDTTIKADNPTDEVAMTQAWIDSGDASARPETVKVPFRITPAEPRLIRAHQGQAYRITYAPRPGETPLPADRESIFYFNLLDVPPKPENSEGKNMLQFAVRTRIKMFYRPAGLQGTLEQSAASLRWSLDRSNGRAVIALDNPTGHYVTVADLKLSNGEKLDVGMVEPHGSLRVELPAGTTPSTAFTFDWIDDYGATREQTATLD